MLDSAQLSEAIAQLRQLTQVDVQAQWGCWFEELSLLEMGRSEGAIAQLNGRNHIPWPKGRRVAWFRQKFVLPQCLQQTYPLAGLKLRLALTWWAEVAQVYVNGELVQEGDLFDHSARVVLSESVVPGEAVEVAIRLISPGHDDGALVRSCLVYESDDLDPGFVADEIAVLQSYLEAFAPAELAELSAAIAGVDWSMVGDRPKFDQALLKMRDRLQAWSDRLKQHTIFLVGHAHLDMAWLWPIDETWNAAERTFTSVLNLQKEFPELTFCHSTPALYEWMEQNRPDLFTQIQQQVKAGKWEIVAGMWIEPELNLISGESIARHILYGQRYCQEKFGAVSRIAWLPDTFGFCWQLPQLLKQGGIDYFVTQKLRWNDTTKFPHEIFEWRSPDGSEILSLMSAPIGEGIDPIKMAAYAWDWTAKTGIFEALWLPGVGDHGGGPTRDMLEIARRWQMSPFFPRLEFTTVETFLDRLNPNIQNTEQTSLPSWNDELYLEFHRGCYTTHADQKQHNRTCEKTLYQAELFASLATLITGNAYPKIELETAWKKVLLNQFHDILPGSSISQVFVDANREWETAEQIASEVKHQSLKAIASQISFPPSPHPKAKAIVVFNALNWQRSQVVTIFDDQDQHKNWQVYNPEGQLIETECQYYIQPQKTFSLTSFLANIPAIGFRCFWLTPCEGTCEETCEETVSQNHSSREPYTLENVFLRVKIDPKTGNLSSIFDKINQREILRGAGNQLQAFRDEGQYWDAWNIDPNYQNHPLPSAKILHIEPATHDNFQSRLSIQRKIGQSVFSESYSLKKDSAVLQVSTSVDWQERHVLVKAAFPLNLEADTATYEMSSGAIQRTTQPKDDRDKAKWEVAALGWADLSEADYGVSILSDCKHGYDCQSDRLRLTLLRGAEFPDPAADRGRHTFTYAIYPHAGSWQAAQTVHKSYELNQPLEVLQLDRPHPQGTLAPTASLLALQPKNLILSAFKPSEENPDVYILRCYECHGEATELKLASDLEIRLGNSVNLLEQVDRSSTPSISPWKIKSFSVLPATRSQPSR
ncbi:MAG: alpha-mannosidase [Leptolyngbyaceae cyanobacterium CSU_1_3]|nr:alpha-mannosidase [Leptolyngbyaceae cyanobacterium CSU_1_3]